MEAHGVVVGTVVGPPAAQPPALVKPPRCAHGTCEYALTPFCANCGHTLPLD
jgi:hypothetical protein